MKLDYEAIGKRIRIEREKRTFANAACRIISFQSEQHFSYRMTIRIIMIAQGGEMMKDNSAKEIANRLKELRQARNISQEKMAELLGISYSTYSKIENAYQNLTIKHLIKISKILNVSADTILFDNYNKPDQLTIKEFVEYASVFENEELIKMKVKLE